MLNHFFKGIDPGDVKTRFLFDYPQGLGRDPPQSRHRLTCPNLDLKPFPEAIFGLPDPGHGLSCVSRNHFLFFSSWISL
jgi:hypothetical protein